MELRRLPAALLVALLVVATAVALRILGAGGGDRPASELLPILVSSAGVCAAALLRHRSPAWAWLATASATALGALEVLASVRAWIPATSPGAGPWLVIVAEAALLGAAAVGAAYATRRPSGASHWATASVAIVLAGAAGVATVAGWAIVEAFGSLPQGLVAGQASDDLPPLRVSGRFAAGFVAVAMIAGAWRDLAGPLRRAWSRSGGLRKLPAAMGDELLPSVSAARRRGRDEERARLAADLHALVLPDLRRAAQAAGGAGDPSSPVAADLRQAVEGVERLIDDRQSVVLEEFGLVAALEWLAERTQEHAAIEVDIELDGPDVDDPSAVPPAVGRSAFRIALLALDNVVRHAHASRALVLLSVEGGRVHLSVTDDGRGFDNEPADRGGRGLGGRGLGDMRAAAAEIGGTFRLERRDGATELALDWSSAAANAGDHATGDAEITSRRTVLEP
jgi:signal transduction histidine kinase